MTTPPAVEERILALSLAHPAWGCNRISDTLKLEGIAASAPTIQGVLACHGLATRGACPKLAEGTAGCGWSNGRRRSPWS